MAYGCFSSRLCHGIGAVADTRRIDTWNMAVSFAPPHGYEETDRRKTGSWRGTISCSLGLGDFSLCGLGSHARNSCQPILLVDDCAGLEGLVTNFVVLFMHFFGWNSAGTLDRHALDAYCCHIFISSIHLYYPRFVDGGGSGLAGPDRCMCFFGVSDFPYSSNT